MEQTPIEMLIEWMNTQSDKSDGLSACIAYERCIEKATELLAAEKERDKQIASLAWDAAENRIDWEREKEVWSKEQPNKEEYLKSLTK